MRRILAKSIFSLLIGLPVFAMPGFAVFGQGNVTGTITGTVLDQSGAAVAGAKVTAVNTDTNLKKDTTTDNNGQYRLPLLPTGSYNVAVEVANFKKATTNGIKLSVNDVLRQDFKLEVGQVTEEISVAGTTSDVNTDNPTLGKVVDNKTINSLPILSGAGGRNPLDLSGLQSGVVAAGQVGPFSVNGQRAQSNNFMLDGGDSNDLAINTPNAVDIINPDAVQEFRILTNNYTAEFGRNSGSVVNLITKSGTNSFHGNLFEFFRNNVLNSTPFFKPTTGPTNPQFNTNDFGGTVGGPIKKDRTFFFFSYLGFRRRQGDAVSSDVPTDAERAAINQFGTPEAKALLALVPNASTGSKLFSIEGNSLNRNQIEARVDHTINSNNRLSVTFFDEKVDDREPFAFGGGNIPGFGEINNNRFISAVVSDSQVFGPNIVNEFRLSFHRQGGISEIPQNTTKIASLGLAGINPDDPTAEGVPNVRINGIDQFGNTIQGPQGRFDNTWQFGDTVSHRLGSHNLKYGGEIRSYAQNQIFDFINNGIYIIDGSGTANGIFGSFPGLDAADGSQDALNDFAHGFATVYAQNSAGRRGYRTRSFNGFVQDEFKLKSYFTINAGLRYEYNSNLTDLKDQVAGFRPGQQSTVFPTAPAGLIFPGDSGISRSTYGSDKNNFGPRVGFAWDVLHNGKLSIRGGYGLYYDIVISELTLQFLTTPPYAIQPNIFFTTLTNPLANSLVNPIAQPFPFTPAKPGDKFDFANVGTLGLTVMDPNFRTPYAHQFNLQTQWEFRPGYTLEVGYVGSMGVKLLTRHEINPADPTIAGANSGNTDSRRLFNQNNPLNTAFGGAVFGSITDQSTSANSSYNSLQVSVIKRFAHGFQFQNAYTYSHCIDNASGLRSNVRFNDPLADRGNCEQDIRHRDAISYIWELPFAKKLTGIEGKMLDGWQVSGFTQFQTGLPFDVFEPSDRSLTGAGDDRPDFVGTGGSVSFTDPHGANNQFFSPSLFQRLPANAGRFGNLGRNVFHGPGFAEWNLSVIKKTKITETQGLEFRAEIFNLFNHTNFANPVTDISSNNFGQVTSTVGFPRIIQFGLKYSF